ncbi:Arm DNA-binding domain-containing protein [Acinetobacter baumannii]
MVLIFYKLLFRKKKYDKFEIFSAWYRRRRRTRYMLTDTKLRNLKPRDKLYKVNDREGLYVAVTPAGSISFRYNYSINGRQETITFGRYGVGGITLAEARELLGDAKKMVAAGKSPAKEGSFAGGGGILRKALASDILR